MGNPLTLVTIWAPSANYPSGPGFEWDGLPIKTPPGFTFFTPSPAFAPTAPQFNAMFNTRDTQLANLTSWTGQLDGQNWSQFLTPTGISGGAALQSMDWSGALGTWLGFTAVISTNYFVYQTADGINWTQLGAALNTTDFSNSGSPVGFAIVTTAAGAVIAFSQKSFTQTYVPASNTWAGAVAGPSGGPFASVNNPQLVRYFNGGLVWAACVGNSATGAAGISFSNNAAVTWTNTGSTLPTNFGATTGNHGLLAAVGATTMLLFSQVPNATQYLSSADGQTWTTNTMPALNTGEQVAGASYDATNGIFYMVVTTLTTESRLFGSTTGLTGSWTLISTFSTNIVPGVGSSSVTAQNGNGHLAANGGELALVVLVGQLYRVIVAQSQTALGTPLVWGFTRSVLPGTTVQIQFAGSGFFAFEAGTYAVTHQAGAPPPLFSL